MRLLILALMTIFAMLLGGYMGNVISYWFMPEIMRMYLSWGEYLQQMPNHLYIGDPIGVAQRVAYCRTIGAFIASALTLITYFRLTNRKKL